VNQEMFVIVPKRGLLAADASALNLKPFEVGKSDCKGRVPDHIYVSKSTAFVLGLFLGDGNSSPISSGTATWHLSEGYKEKYVSHVLEWLSALGLSPVAHRYDKTINVAANSTKLARFLSHHFYSRPEGSRGPSTSKEIPRFVWAWPDELVSSFLFGWHEADGKHLKRIESPRGMSTSSKAVAMGAVDLFVRLGFPPTVDVEPPRGKSRHVSFTVNLGNRAVRELNWPLPTHNKKSRRLYQEDENNYYLPITRNERFEYSGPVYDQTTLTSEYCVPFVIHNSNEVLQGRGFVGASGILLWHLCKAAGLPPREDVVWVSNSGLCAPHDVRLTTGALLKEDEVKVLATKACRRRLLWEIRYVTQNDPRAVVVPIGKLALWSVSGLDDPKIMSHRGSVTTKSLDELIASLQRAA